MDKEDMLWDLWQASLSFRHLAQSTRGQNLDSPICANTADYHATQIEQIIKYLTDRAE